MVELDPGDTNGLSYFLGYELPWTFKIAVAPQPVFGKAEYYSLMTIHDDEVPHCKLFNPLLNRHGLG